MSWLDDIVDFGSNILSGVGNFLGSNSLGSNVLKTVLTGYALNKVTDSINKDNDATSDTNISITNTPDTGVRVQTAASTETKIPVLYGEAVIGGALIDARMTNDNKTMYYVYALSEVTGNLMSTGSASEITLKDVYWNDQRIVFGTDGITASYAVDRSGKVDRSIDGLVRVYYYKNGSSNGVVPENYSGSVPSAYSIVPDWTSDWRMDNTVFAVVRVDYNREKGVTGIANTKFHLSNTLTLPGDVLYDQMTSTRYGAGIDVADIKVA
mgnify:CR=1 FL=1